MTVSLQQIADTAVADVVKLSSLDLMSLQQQAREAYQQAKRLKESIDGAIALKYAELDQYQRHQQGKETGTVRFVDNDVRITADLPKKVSWDQAVLATIARRIRDSGDDPDEFIQSTYKIPEKTYNAWPEHLQAVFRGARIVSTGKPSFQLSSLDSNNAAEQE